VGKNPGGNKKRRGKGLQGKRSLEPERQKRPGEEERNSKTQAGRVRGRIKFAKREKRHGR